MLRRIIVPDDDEQLNDPSHVGSGETILKVSSASAMIGKNITAAAESDPSARVSMVDSAIAAVSNATGKDATPVPHAIVDKTGMVVRMVLMDPAIDAVPEGFLAIANREAGVGWTMKDGILQGPPSVQIKQDEEAEAASK